MYERDDPEQWVGRSLIHLVTWAAERHGETPVVRYGADEVTYAELETDVWDVAKGLYSSGLRPGDRVGVVLEDIPEAIVSIVAASILGCPPLVMSVRNTPPELEYLLNAGEATTVITQTESSTGNLLERYSAVFEGDESDDLCVPTLERVIRVTDGESASEVQHLDGPESVDYEAIRQGVSDRKASPGVGRAVKDVSPGDTAVILFTSGTTSTPKAVIRTHRNLLPHAVDAASWYDISAGDVLLNAYPIPSAAGILRFLMAVSRGATCVLQGHYTLEETMSYLLDGEVNYISGPDTVFKDLLSHPDISEIDPDPLERVFLSMGGGLDVEFGADVENVFETPVENAYGLTEANPLLLRTRRTHPFDARVRPGGLTGYGATVRLDGGESRGEICVRGVSVTPGYENNDAANAAAFDEDGWFHTSDQGRSETIDGTAFCFFANRSDAMFQVGGFNVSPMEVEACLREHPSVTWAGVAGIDHERLGAVPGAVVTTAEDVDPTSITEFCQARLSDQKVPRTVFVIDESEVPYSEGVHGRKLDREGLDELLERSLEA